MKSIRKLFIILLLLLMCINTNVYAKWVNKNGQTYYKVQGGKYYKNTRKKIGKYYYYFDKNRCLVKNTWIKKRYYNKKGRQVFNKFVGDRYVGKKGKYVTGLKTIKKKTYYFNPSNGYMVKNQTIKINGKLYTFGNDGVHNPNNKDLEDSYYTDPVVSDEDLLAALIYCESGNQPFDGQLAVGFVVLNRVKSPLFPNTIKEVIYAVNQFTPAYNTNLTKALKGKITVSASAKRASSTVMKMYASNNYNIKNAKSETINMQDYIFFMTPGAYDKLKLKAKKLALWGHVFLKEWC